MKLKQKPEHIPNRVPNTTTFTRMIKKSMYKLHEKNLTETVLTFFSFFYVFFFFVWVINKYFA